MFHELAHPLLELRQPGIVGPSLALAPAAVDMLAVLLAVPTDAWLRDALPTPRREELLDQRLWITGS